MRNLFFFRCVVGVSLLATLTKLGYKILIVLAFVAQEDPASMLQFAACSDARKESWIFTKIGGPFHCPGRGDAEIHYFLCASECDIGGKRFPFASRNPFLEYANWNDPPANGGYCSPNNDGWTSREYQKLLVAIPKAKCGQPAHPSRSLNSGCRCRTVVEQFRSRNW